ncbi:MAG: uracil-DNA glycosylase [Myxococcota bacterium]
MISPEGVSCDVPSPLPEIPAPPEGSAALSPLADAHRSRIVWAEGTPGAPLAIVLDNPGAREAVDGTPMVCGTRTTLRQTTHAAGLRDEDLYVTWVLKWRPRRAYDRAGAHAACLPWLEAELLAARPRVLLCLGDVATRALLADPSVSVKALRQSPRTWHGIPLVVGYHPLAVRRRPVLAPTLMEDVRRAARIAREGPTR